MDCSSSLHPGLPRPSLSPGACSNSHPLIESVMPSNHLILGHRLLLLPSMCPSIRAFSNESALHIGWPKYWSISIIPSNQYSRLISLGLTGLCLLLSKRLWPQFESNNSSALSFFMVQFSHSYMTVAKMTALTIRTFATKVMSFYRT